MSSSLTAERVRRDVDVLAHAGLDVGTFLAELDASLQRAVPYVGACVATVDPATLLLTGTYKHGDLVGRDERDFEWGLLEYGSPEPTTFSELALGGGTAASVSLTHGGDLAASPRLRELITPQFGFADELRLIGRAGDRVWGGIAMFRGPDDAPFTPSEVDFVASLSGALASGMRSGLLARLAARASVADTGPAVVVIDSSDTVVQTSVGALERLDALRNADSSAATSGIVASLVARARQYAAGVQDLLPRSRVRLASGQWVVLHASPLAGADGRHGDVVLTIEEARPPEIVPIVVAAFDLTPRERDVTALVLQGVETKAIASRLHLSAYTVQDHLKSVFEKADVRSRRELIARVFFDQYLPRLGQDVGTDGWFAG